MGKQKQNKKDKQHAKGKKNRFTAATADKHLLYEKSVQDPPHDIKFIERVYKKEYGRKPESLREDFCGTALMCADWVRKKPERHAVGLDLHAPTLRWGMKHNLEPLGEDAKRVELMERNVLDGAGRSFDVVVAFNFSYCVFRERKELLDYFEAVRREVGEEGVFFLDIHGGTELTVELEEDTDHDGFTYVWDQEPYDAINGYAKRHIHFEFPDGTKMRRAFTYEWRLWGLPEIQDILREAGYSRIHVYWEGTDEDGEGNGVFRRAVKAEQEESWIAYVVAWP